MLNHAVIRRDFPLLAQKNSTQPIVYLDSTATSLRPYSVIAKEREYYESYSANIHRGIYAISEKATEAYENARAIIASFIHAQCQEIIFTRNTTESLNLVMYALLKAHIPDGEIVTTILEHHSNFVPWQELSLRNMTPLKICHLTNDLLLDEEMLERLITKKTMLVTFTAVSNVLGTIVPVKIIVRMIKSINPSCLVLVDAAQAVPHMQVNVDDWGADLVAFSGHKMLGPTGIGVLWGTQDVLEKLAPFQYGGDMISEVHVDKTVYAAIPHKFEAGTPHIAGAIGLGQAVEYLQKLGMDNVREHEKHITVYALQQLQKVKGITIFCPKHIEDHAGVIAFQMKGIHPHDIAQILDSDGICIRVGYHCAQPLHEYLNIGPTARISSYVYTSEADIDACVIGLEKVNNLFR